MNNIQISKNFKLKEFQCGDGGYQVRLDSQVLKKLQELREQTGRPVLINSGYRTPSYNQQVGGSPRSQHLLGKAADIMVPGMELESLARVAEGIGFGGIGIYRTFIHVDVRSEKVRWKG
ncbi:Peptidase M15A [Alkaliphilus metalliredigens QYMF]|uniref:Murein endopeptidase K n=1 Tax=Alkaliphilus metalliredigens (strain QYMF) TaxID=293826 RepID=A6TKN9_ALKMQ|nr:D-Ala-D-Ala carboxypeptidase family metallohydrolase [Alkaliphilus metalliredigens]ABR46757.1 Peptidase M15A [Alkaliphilus metalliredigens QYMF]